jgi:AcrR family transcriptional regulator
MSRSRVAILAGAAQCILRYGTRKTTMGDIARLGGVAKATLYNHFRDKSEVYAALVASEVELLVATAAAEHDSAPTDERVFAALVSAATGVAVHPVLRKVAESEPGVLGLLQRYGDAAPWQHARAYAVGVVRAANGSADADGTADILLRWVASHAGWPETEGIEAAARSLAELVMRRSIDVASTLQSQELRDAQTLAGS